MIAGSSTRRTRSRDGLGIPGLLAAVGLCVSCATDGVQTDAPGYEPGRTAWGTPVIEGTWDYRSLTPLERPPEFADKPVLTREEAEAFRQNKVNALDSDNRAETGKRDLDGAYNSFWLDWGTELDEELRTSLIVDPPDGQLPDLTPTARANMEAQMRERTPPVREVSSPGGRRPPGPEWLGVAERCLIGVSTGPPIIPSAYNNNIRIVQTPDYVLLVNEMVHDARIIPMDGRPHGPSDLNRWLGESRGRWEDDTLVIDTTNFTDKTSTFKLPVGPMINFSYEGSVGSAKNMRLTERLTPVAEGRLLYEFTVDDPKAFVRPFTGRFMMRPTEGPMFEYACHEGNYAVENTLKGARFIESQGD